MSMKSLKRFATTLIFNYMQIWILPKLYGKLLHPKTCCTIVNWTGDTVTQVIRHIASWLTGSFRLQKASITGKGWFWWWFWSFPFCFNMLQSEPERSFFRSSFKAGSKCNGTADMNIFKEQTVCQYLVMWLTSHDLQAIHLQKIQQSGNDFEYWKNTLSSWN